MKKFNEGNTVKLVWKDQHPGEISNWSAMDELEVGQEYIVSVVYESGWIDLEGCSYSHHPDKFELVSPAKLDAYISSAKELVYWDQGIHTGSIVDAYKYNLISADDFYKAHPQEKETLNLFGWKVKVGEKSIYINHYPIFKSELKHFHSIIRWLKHENKDVHEFWDWLENNREELGL